MAGPIVRASIHPGIGIARVGDSPDEFFIGPEVRFPAAAPPGSYKDAAGALKRQAARFRIYGLDRDGKVVEELNASNADITWTVHVANKKAAWYNFERAMDIPEALPCARRNHAYAGADRQRLVIDPGPRSIAGQPHQRAAPFDTGLFLGEPVYLGELRTDDRGNLLFLGGRGRSGTPFANNTPYTFANNDGWHDDVSDGPVSAIVTIDGRDVPVEPAWVVVAPPNFAPDIIAVQTMYDLLYDVYQEYWIAPVTRPSFTEHIYPLLRQFSDGQWVNYGFHAQFGWGGPQNFLRPQYVAKLATLTRDRAGRLTDIYRPLRRQVLHLFRQPGTTDLDPSKWPQVYGDAMDVPGSPRANLTLTRTQYQFLQDWAAGNFDDDWTGVGQYPVDLESLPIPERPMHLDRAALWFCLGGPFHPGCEMTWPMRTPTVYSAPFRIRPRAEGQPEPDYGNVLTPDVATSPSGPLFAHGPGDVTRWMAVPWQTDSASCRAGYEPDYDPYLPTFWPARVPNHVLSADEYARVMDTSQPIGARREAFDTRANWPRWLSGVGLDQTRQMVSDFGRMGVIERRDGPGDDDAFPPALYVESQVGFDHHPHFQQNLTNGLKEKLRRHRRRDPLG
jgi:hypothetical protein